MKSLNKLKLVRLLKSALECEEKAVPIYYKHLESAVFWTGLSEDKISQLKNTLRLLAKESAAHKMVVDKILVELCGRK